MNDASFRELCAQFQEALADCRALYREAAEAWLAHEGPQCALPQEQRRERMEELHQGLLIKVFGAVAQADRRWAWQEAELASILIEHLWQRRLSGQELTRAVEHLITQGHRIRWYPLLRPFDVVPALRDEVDRLETIVLRVANLVAKCDGTLSPAEAAHLRTLQDELASHLRGLTLQDTDDNSPAERSTATASAAEQGAVHEAIERAAEVAGVPAPAASGQRRTAASARTADPTHRTPAERLEAARRELDSLIGLASVKREITTLVNYLAHQQQRRALNLPTAPLSLHMLFLGNPGTGKTTVARIFGQMLGALGVLAKGHLVETDRSGLVAEYAGQTGPKTHRKIDAALDGVLFIDEAYSLAELRGDDTYGREALQVLLKRMEDDRHRLAVILAGYPRPMQRLLRVNPGLASRIATHLEFPDYTPQELAQVFQVFCEKNHYRLPAATRAKLLVGFHWLHAHRNERFGNARLVRNIFERAVRQLANRIAGVTPVTVELLTVMQPEDLILEGVPAEVLSRAGDPELVVGITCPGCQVQGRMRARRLGETVQCKACQHTFVAEWGELLS